MNDIRRRAAIALPVAAMGLIPLASASATDNKSYGPLNDRFLASKPEIAAAFDEVRPDISHDEAVKLLDAMRKSSHGGVQFELSNDSRIAPLGGSRKCVKIHRWVLMTIYVAWKVNGWAAALAAIPASTAGVAPGVILAAIGIGYGEGAGALKKYIDSHSVWPRKICVWVE